MEDTHFYQHIDRLSLFYSYFVFLDTDAYLADQLFIKHQVRVHFCEEYVRGDSPYRAIFCHVRKRDRERFQAALEELPKKMMLLGYIDYLDVCHALWANVNSGEKEANSRETVDTIGQAQQEGQTGISHKTARVLERSQSCHPDRSE